MIHIVLFEPEIILNTGNIARICVGFNAKLHLIRPYGFILDQNRFHKDFIRAATNHIDTLNLAQYDDFDEFLTINQISNDSTNIFFYTRYGSNTPANVKYPDYTNQEVYLVFGKESTGIDHAILKQFPNQWIRIPTSFNLRSLNVANSVSMGIYELARAYNFAGLLTNEPHKKFE